MDGGARGRCVWRGFWALEGENRVKGQAQDRTGRGSLRGTRLLGGEKMASVFGLAVGRQGDGSPCCLRTTGLTRWDFP